MRSPTRTVRFEKVWSPASRGPRFSRRTPDRLLARADANRSVTTIGDPTSWDLGILTSKVRTRTMLTAIFQQPLRGDIAHPHAPYGVGSQADSFKADNR